MVSMLAIVAVVLVVAAAAAFFWAKGRKIAGAHVFRASRFSRGNFWFPTQVAVTLYRLVAAHNASQPLFTDLQERRRLAVAMDEVNAIFGGNTIYFGGMHDVRKTAPTRIGFANIPDKAAWNDD